MSGHHTYLNMPSLQPVNSNSQTVDTFTGSILCISSERFDEPLLENATHGTFILSPLEATLLKNTLLNHRQAWMPLNLNSAYCQGVGTQPMIGKSIVDLRPGAPCDGCRRISSFDIMETCVEYKRISRSAKDLLDSAAYSLAIQDKAKHDALITKARAALENLREFTLSQPLRNFGTVTRENGSLLSTIFEGPSQSNTCSCGSTDIQTDSRISSAESLTGSESSISPRILRRRNGILPWMPVPWRHSSEELSSQNSQESMHHSETVNDALNSSF